jgi:hypothetical protein
MFARRLAVMLVAVASFAAIACGTGNDGETAPSPTIGVDRERYAEAAGELRAYITERYGPGGFTIVPATHACTAVGCDSGVSFDLEDWLFKHPRLAPEDIEVCANGVCSPVLTGSPRASVALDELQSGDRVEVTVRTTSGKVIATGTFAVEPDDALRPNGPDCEPTCWIIRLELTYGGQLRRAPSEGG